MTVQALVYLLLSLIGVRLWMFYGPHRRLRIDETRAQLFVVRERLFDAAAKGESIRFEDRAYGMARTMLNGMLRTLEDQGLVYWAIISWRLSRSESERAECVSYMNDFRHARGELSREGRELVQSTIDEAMQILLAHMVSTSLCLLTLARLRLLTLLWKQWRPLRRRRVQSAIRFQSDSAGHRRNEEDGYAVAA